MSPAAITRFVISTDYYRPIKPKIGLPHRAKANGKYRLDHDYAHTNYAKIRLFGLLGIRVGNLKHQTNHHLLSAD